MSLEQMLANRVKNVKGSAIREIFKLLQQPDMISFAGGVPAPEMFPRKELAEISHELLLQDGMVALQYGITEGYEPLREKLRAKMSQAGIQKDGEDVIIVSGGQQGIDLAAKIFLNEGDGIVVESPSFIGGLNTFRICNAAMYPVDVEEDGLNIEQLEKHLKDHKNIKLIYTIPTFQNPSGITMTLEKRKKLLEIAERYNVYIIEDNPYGELRFKGEEVVPIKCLDDHGRVIYIGSFSKILSPGLRLGWVVAPSEMLERMVVLKQVSDVHSNLPAQMMTERYMERYSIDAHVALIKELYGKRCGWMIACMEQYFPEYCSFTRPEGGLFIWCTLPERYNAVDVMKQTVKRKVAFVPGNTFMTEMDLPSSSFRLNYSTMSENKIEEGIKILGEVLKGL